MLMQIKVGSRVKTKLSACRLEGSQPAWFSVPQRRTANARDAMGRIARVV